MRDGDAAHVVADWGGTLFNFGPIRPRLEAYAESAERFRDIAAKAGADVILSNHTATTAARRSCRRCAARKPGEPHPYVVGNDVVRRYLTVATSARRPRWRSCPQPSQPGANAKCKMQNAKCQGNSAGRWRCSIWHFEFCILNYLEALMEAVPVKFVPRGFGETYRRDAWWVEPLVVFLVLGGFVVYATWAAFQNAHYTYGPYLSPFYSPVIFGDGEHAWFGPKPGWWPAFAPFSPALLILPFPGLFRFTCYYYRGAYYKAFWADPISCSVGEPRARVLRRALVPAGAAERPPLLRLHRRLFLFVLTYDVWLALWFPNRDGADGVRHRPRHHRPGGQRRASQQLHARLSLDSAPARRRQGRSLEVVYAPGLLQLLERAQLPAQLFAWMSLFSVAFADVYVRLCSMGIRTDWRII